MDLSKLSDPFPAGDIEWRVSRSGVKAGTVWCNVLAYITARAIANRLDTVCGPGNWCNTPMVVSEMRVNVVAVQVGISIRIGDQWVTKYDVAEPTDIEPAKGGFSGAMKRAGSQWGIGRYLYQLDEEKADTSDDWKKGYNWAKLSDKIGGGSYYWKPPQLPSWALPRIDDSEIPVTEKQVAQLKNAWMKKLASGEKNRAKLSEAFHIWVESIIGTFPAIDDPTCWTQGMIDDCSNELGSATGPRKGPSPSVKF